jgi:hypothetical protein
VARVLSDHELRARLVERAGRRAHDFDLDKSRRAFSAAVLEAVDADGLATVP